MHDATQDRYGNNAADLYGSANGGFHKPIVGKTVRHDMDAKYFAGCLDEIMQACERIKDEDLCSECPMSHMCVEDTPFWEIAEECPQDHFREIVDMGENPKWYVMSEDAKDEVKSKLRRMGDRI